MDAISAAAIGLALSLSAGPVPGVRVDWNKGGGPAKMRIGIPNPPGWYKAAVGPRTTEKVLYLTFDDGPSRYTPRLLKALARNKARATFFVVGGPAASRPEVIRRMHRHGNAVGNHTWSHPRLTTVSTRIVRSELLRTKSAIGPVMAGCMRPPYGLVDARVAHASIAAGFQPVMWTAHIDDWVPHSMGWTLRRLQRDTTPGAVILMHDTHAQTVAAVSRMLPRWVKQGYRFETVPVCQ